jgi:hypothetical protein
MTLNDLAWLDLSTGRARMAMANLSEAEHILDPFWCSSPSTYGDWMAQVLLARAQTCGAIKTPGTEACALARRALAARGVHKCRKVAL